MAAFFLVWWRFFWRFFLIQGILLIGGGVLLNWMARMDMLPVAVYPFVAGFGFLVRAAVCLMVIIYVINRSFRNSEWVLRLQPEIGTWKFGVLFLVRFLLLAFLLAFLAGGILPLAMLAWKGTLVGGANFSAWIGNVALLPASMLTMLLFLRPIFRRRNPMLAIVANH